MTSSSLKSSSSAKKPFETFDVFLAVAAILLTVMELVRLWPSLTMSNEDITHFFLPWLDHILSNGRWSSMEGGFANYNPPYLYLLSAASLLHGRVAPIVIVKMTQVPGLVVSSWLFWSICHKLGCSQLRSLLAAWTVLLAPEVFNNAIAWGQCDMLHTACLLGMLRLLLARRPGWAMLLLGVALAFKLQAVFAGAAVAALLLAGEVPLWSALLVPLGYVAMLVPAWMAGRPWKDLWLIYGQQYSSMPDLALHVANPYQLIYRPNESYGPMYLTALYGGLVLAAAATVWLTIFLARSPWRLRGKWLIFSFAVALLMEPYLLPKMHDRYFFAGDTFLLLLAMMRPQLWLPAMLLQASAVIIAYPYVYLHMVWYEPTPFYMVPVVLTTVALAWVGWVFLTAEASAADPDL